MTFLLCCFFFLFPFRLEDFFTITKERGEIVLEPPSDRRRSLEEIRPK